MEKKLLIALLFLSFGLSAKTLEVCENCQFQNIASAIQAASNGDTIQIQKGLYKEGSVVVDKELTIIGNDSIIDGLGKEHVLDIKANHVTIQNLTIQNSGISDRQEFAGIHAEGISDCKFIGNHLENNTYGFYLAKVSNCLIEKNSSWGNAIDEVLGGNGIHLWYSDHIKIFKNTIKNHRDGLYFEFSNDIEIKNNTSSNCVRYGMHFMFSHRNQFIDNIFIKNPTGVAVMYSKKIQIIGNRFEDSRGMSAYGILLKDITDSIFERNIFYNNTIGIFSDNSLRNIFKNNYIQKNGWAIHLLGNSDDNVFMGNNIIDNIFDVSTNSRRNPNIFENNYWSKYRGYDLDNNGIGDIPYRPVQLYSYLIQFYPVLSALLQSPSIEILEIAEKAFPILTPVNLVDTKPNMKRL
ncbi:MAG: nitrous oxide reductase family maturation protein NosD [Leptospiraceae bacterium]|nr:nitrous oxide reductase family maturation protein NosD [Leptospiraceae bacterium]